MVGAAVLCGLVLTSCQTIDRGGQDGRFETAAPQTGPAYALCAEIPPESGAPPASLFEGFWNATPADDQAEVLEDPALWVDQRMREHPRVAMVDSDTGVTLETWDRVACENLVYPDFSTPFVEDWPADAEIAVDMDTGEFLGAFLRDF